MSSMDAKIRVSEVSMSEDDGAQIVIMAENVSMKNVLMFLMALGEWIEDVTEELNNGEPEEPTPSNEGVIHDPANQQEPNEPEAPAPRQKRKYTKRQQPAEVKAEPEQKVVIDEKQTTIPGVGLTEVLVASAMGGIDPAKIANTVIKVEKKDDPPFDLAPAKQPTAEDLAVEAEVTAKLEAENAAEFAAVDKVMQNYEMHLANIRSDFAVADAVSVWLKIEPDFKKANASDMVIGVAQDSLVRTVEGLLKTSYDTARNLVGAAVKKEREKRAAEPITVKAEEPAPNDDEEAKFVAALASQTSLAQSGKMVIQHKFKNAKTVKIGDALEAIKSYKASSSVLNTSNDNTLRTVIPTLIRQLGMSPTA